MINGVSHGSKTWAFKWFYVAKWLYVAKWFYVVKWFYVAKSDEKWLKVVISCG